MRPADLDHRAQLRQARRAQGAGFGACKLGHQRVQHLHVDRGLERGGRDDRGAADLAKREFQFAQPIGGVDRHQDQPGFGGGELRQRPFGAVERPDADPHPAFQPEREETRSQRVDAFGKFLPGPAHIVARRNQRLAITPAPRRVVEAPADGVAEQRRVGNTADVTVRFVCQDCVAKTIPPCPRASSRSAPRISDCCPDTPVRAS